MGVIWDWLMEVIEEGVEEKLEKVVELKVRD